MNCMQINVPDQYKIAIVILHQNVHRLPAANQDAAIQFLETWTQWLTYKLHCKRHQLYLNM